MEGSCKCQRGQTVAVAYITRGGKRQYYFSCSFCDSTRLWPVFNHSSTPKPSKP